VASTQTERAKTAPRGLGQIVSVFHRMSQTFTGRMVNSILLALAVVIPVRTFAIQGYHIPSGSMEKSLLIGDVLFADKITFGPRIPLTNSARIPGFREPEPGDVVIFKHPAEKIDLIKRCVAVGGQVVEMRDKRLYVDGEPVDESYIQHTDPYPNPHRDTMRPLRVPAGHIFVLGDNRDNSNDSRFIGTIPVGLVVAKARIIYWSWDTRGGHWWQVWNGRPRLGRIGTLL